MPARRVALGALAILIILLGSVVGIGVARGGWQAAPTLALDLEGGTQVILQAKSRDGKPVDQESMEQARQIMAQRINAMGVAETEISIQGGSNIVVDVPGKLDPATSQALRQTAAMSFRPVLGVLPPEGEAGSSDAGGASDGGGANGSGEESKPAIDPSQPTFNGPLTPRGGPGEPNTPVAPSTDDLPFPAWSLDWATPEVQAAAFEANCTDPKTVQKKAQQADPHKTLVVCDPTGSQKFLLGPVTVEGKDIQTSSVGDETTPTGQNTGFYVVNMLFKPSAAQNFSEMTIALHGGQGATDMFAIVLDGQVISAPQVREPTSTGETSITGNFKHDEASRLSNQLRFGALPLEFEVASEQQISATLGSDQLEKGLIAGLIGLLLVVVYAFFQYRVLAIVTTSSLVIMGVLAYAVLTILSNLPEVGYRLSLAGVVGLVVSIAFTADSFIVYFERVRDEIREGRGIVAAVDHGWARARQTIVISDMVNVIAAVVLYLLSTGGVRGFAFTLGLATLLDLLIVFLFTHPLLQALVRTRFFGKGHPLSGLDPAALGRSVPAYAGRGRVRTTAERRGRKGSEQPVRETLAERKARLAREEKLAREESAEMTQREEER